MSITFTEPTLFDTEASQGGAATSTQPTTVTPVPRPGSHHPTALLEAVADHWLPARQDDRQVIEAAIARSLAEVGEVHIALVRDRLARPVEPHMLGAVISAWATRHGECIDVRPNGDTKSGNGAKLARVWRLKTS